MKTGTLTFLTVFVGQVIYNNKYFTTVPTVERKLNYLQQYKWGFSWFPYNLLLLLIQLSVLVKGNYRLTTPW